MPEPTTCPGFSRRRFLAAAAASLRAPAPASPVAIARCLDYGPALAPTLKTMLGQLGGLSRLVAGKTVSIKINLTGPPSMRMGTTPAEYAHYTHPAVIGATVRLMGEAGARRIRILEGCFSTPDPLPEFMLDAGWDPTPLLNAAPSVEMVNTNLLGAGRRYSRFNVSSGKGFIFPGFDLHPAYDECDVLVSIAKLKEHATCGITLAMKNMFGATPITIYGDAAAKDEPADSGCRGGRGSIMHSGLRGPCRSAPQEVDRNTPRDDKYRMPRIVADIAAARPIHLSILDGIATMTGGEGPWISGPLKAVRPGILIAGLNPVCTDSVGAAVMGFDPMAVRGAAPFEHCDSTLLLAEQHGVGSRDLSRIEIAGLPISQALFRFRA